MNERIKELAQLAAESVIDDKINAVMITESEDNKLEIPDTFIKSFAELIIKECADHIDDLVTCDDDGNQMLDCDDVRTELLEHFGVEE